MEGVLFYSHVHRDNLEIQLIERKNRYIVNTLKLKLISGNYFLNGVQLSGMEFDVITQPPDSAQAKGALGVVDGGIDLNAGQLKLNETGGKIDFSGAVDAAALDRQIAGFNPVILSVTPLKNPQAFFGAGSQ